MKETSFFQTFFKVNKLSKVVINLLQIIKKAFTSIFLIILKAYIMGKKQRKKFDLPVVNFTIIIFI
jgi:hypothetical protein